MSYSIKIEEIENGYVVLRPLEVDQKWVAGKKWVEKGTMACDEAIVQIEALKREFATLEAENAKQNKPTTAKKP